MVEDKMIGKEEYSYNELDENGKQEALNNMYSTIRAFLDLPTGACSVDRPLIECVISMLDSVFDKEGNPQRYSKKYKEVKPELIRDIYEQCNKGK